MVKISKLNFDVPHLTWNLGIALAETKFAVTSIPGFPLRQTNDDEEETMASALFNFIPDIAQLLKKRKRKHGKYGPKICFFLFGHDVLT